MSTEKTTVVAPDGTTTTYVSVDGAQHVGLNHDGFDGGSFFAGVFIAVAAVLASKFVKRRRARLDARGTGRVDDDFAALAKRTATLERIVTEPATRLDREIEALRSPQGVSDVTR